MAVFMRYADATQSLPTGERSEAVVAILAAERIDE